MSEAKRIKIEIEGQGTIEISGSDEFITFFRDSILFATAKRLEDLAMTGTLKTKIQDTEEWSETISE